tara:strand:- start:304 stop:807 length:504 start_codon:yes stop_codon:yes gene_type:complete
MDRIALIKPQYVWITSGLGKWTNEKGAEILAKRAAGIDTLNIVSVARLSDSNFCVVDEAEFKKKSNNRRYTYMYGDISQAPQGNKIYGDISVISTNDWNRVAYYTTDITHRPPPEIPPSRKELIKSFEHEVGSLAPSPQTCTEWVKSVEEGFYYAIVLAAMVIGEPE